MRETLTTTDGRTLGWERRGAGPLLVCHPGGPGFSARGFDQAAGLDQHFTLILLDPRGTGASERPAEPTAYSIEDYVGDVEELRNQLGEEAVNLLGWSHGGMVAMAYAATHPARVRRLVLVATLARFQAEQEEAMQAGIAKRSGEPWFEDAVAALEEEQNANFANDEEVGALTRREFPLYFGRYDDAGREYLERTMETPNADTLGHFNREIFPTFDLRPDLARVTAPALVLAGEEDFIAGPVCATDIASALPGAELVVIPEVGHFLFHEAPDRMRAEIFRFVA